MLRCKPINTAPDGIYLLWISKRPEGAKAEDGNSIKGSEHLAPTLFCILLQEVGSICKQKQSNIKKLQTGRTKMRIIKQRWRLVTLNISAENMRQPQCPKTKDKTEVEDEKNWKATLSIVVVQSLSRVRLFATPWTAACQASLSFTISPSLLKLTSIESVMLSIQSNFLAAGWGSFSLAYFLGFLNAHLGY